MDTSENQINDSKDDDANLSVNDGNTSLNSSLNSSQEKNEDGESKTNVDGQMIFTCNVCRTFKGTLNDSRQHESKNHPDLPHVCTSIMCLGAYKTPSGLLKHINRRHLVTGTKCQWCQKSFSTDLEKCRHQCMKEQSGQSDSASPSPSVKETKDKKVKPPIESSGQASEIEEAAKANHVVQLSRPGHYKCTFLCGYSTNRSGDRPRHESTCDLNPRKQFGCMECHTFICGKLNYKQHILVAHIHQPVTHRGKGRGQGKT